MGLTRMRALLVLGGEHTSQTPKSTIAELHRIFCHKIIIFHPKCSLIPISSMRAVSSLSCNWSGWNKVFFSADQSSSWQISRHFSDRPTLKLLATSFAAKTLTVLRTLSAQHQITVCGNATILNCVSKSCLFRRALRFFFISLLLKRGKKYSH